MFLKPYNLTLSINLSAEAAQLPITVKPTDIYIHMKVRVSEHQSVSPRTGKRVKVMLSMSGRDHMLDCDHIVAWEDFSIIDRESNRYLLETRENLFIKQDNLSLNRKKYSQELFLF